MISSKALPVRNPKRIVSACHQKVTENKPSEGFRLDKDRNQSTAEQDYLALEAMLAIWISVI